jgi:hypothetical protein
MYSFYSPNINNDGTHSCLFTSFLHVIGHNTNTSVAASWLKGFLANKLNNANFSANNLIVITFDEGSNTKNNQIYTLFLGPYVSSLAGTSNCNLYNHYSLLRTVEDNFGVGTLGRGDSTATPITPDNGTVNCTTLVASTTGAMASGNGTTSSYTSPATALYYGALQSALAIFAVAYLQ